MFTFSTSPLPAGRQANPLPAYRRQAYKGEGDSRSRMTVGRDDKKKNTPIDAGVFFVERNCLFNFLLG